MIYIQMGARVPKVPEEGTRLNSIDRVLFTEDTVYCFFTSIDSIIQYSNSNGNSTRLSQKQDVVYKMCSKTTRNMVPC